MCLPPCFFLIIEAERIPDIAIVRIQERNTTHSPELGAVLQIKHARNAGLRFHLGPVIVVLPTPPRIPRRPSVSAHKAPQDQFRGCGGLQSPKLKGHNPEKTVA